MKKLLLIVLFFLVAAGLLAQTNSDWKWIHPRPVGQIMRYVKMFDANNWIIAGDYGNFLKTTDGGVTWRNSVGGYQNSSYPGAGTYNSFKCGYFFNANTGFLGVTGARGIVKTTNSGFTFDTIKILASGTGTINSIYFLNSMTGYFAGTTNFKVMKTTNGGDNWFFLPNTGFTTYSLYNVYASDTNNIIVSSYSGIVYKTTDGGQNWSTINTGTNQDLFVMKFVNATTGYVAAAAFCGRTTDAGLTWTGSTTPSTGFPYSMVLSGSEVYISGTDPGQSLFKSTDNGTTWTTIPYSGYTMNTMWAYGFDKIGSLMLITGNYGDMLKSTNNGANWIYLTYKVSESDLTGIYAESNNGRVIAIGKTNPSTQSIIISSNGGNNWISDVYSTSGSIDDIKMLNPLTGFICGASGRFAKTTNGGMTWDNSLSGNPAISDPECNGIDFVNSTTGWIVGGFRGVGAYMKISKTTNGGVNWTQQAYYQGSGVYCGMKIKMYDANTGYMSDNMNILKTTNGGNNWIVLPNPAPYLTAYPTIGIADAVNAFTGSSNSEVYATSNGGATWDSLNFPVNAGAIICMDWYNNQTGCVGGVIGIVGKTTNRGQTWQISNNGGYSIKGIKMVHPDTIFAVAGNSVGAQIFKYSKGLVSGGFIYEHKLPSEFSLKQNYPNPFNPVTTIEFDLPKQGNITIKIFDIAGREYFTDIRNLRLNPGNYKMNFDGSMLSSGMYFYSLIVNDNIVDTKKLVLLK
jgi:photosystem II stability/assembly factor-like uncharacterized protein